MKLAVIPTAMNELSRSAGNADPFRPYPFVSSLASPEREKM